MLCVRVCVCALEGGEGGSGGERNELMNTDGQGDRRSIYLIPHSHPETHGRERTAFHTIGQHSSSSRSPFVQKKMLTPLQRGIGTPDLNPGLLPEAGIATGEAREQTPETVRWG